MAECLGIYLESNLIKYAKVRKERDTLKIESFGIKTYERLEDTIDQVVRETASLKTPISINLSDEQYNYFEIFAMLNKKDIERTIKTEFDFLCEETGQKQNTIETRHFLIPSKDDKEKIRAVHISTNRVDIAKKNQLLQGKMLRNIEPLPIALTNLLDVDSKENLAIVNIEEKTTITLIIEGKVYKVQVLEDGMKNILANINAKENSYARSYDICKNTTIYTMELQENDTSEYLEDIMPTLFNIVEATRQLIGETALGISKVYITGSGAIINNIDLYFQDNLSKTKCQILRPYFLSNGEEATRIKDYIEVNSAIALAMQGLGEGIKGLNFNTMGIFEKIPMPNLNIELPSLGKGKLKSLAGKKISFAGGLDGFKGPLDRIEKSLLRLAGGILLITILYSGFSYYIGQQIEEKKALADETANYVSAQIKVADSDLNNIRTRTSEYDTRIKKLQETSNKITEKNKTRNSIPNLLNRIMFTVPKSVQITSIKNTQNKHIVIKAQSEKYEQLGYFKGQLSVDGILNDVKSDSGVKQDGIVKVTIEGDLP
ncbi:MAG: hypothetical protein IJ223_00350 [Clostridia bacterium]|nr:hypothetical protein [Clostridia bacterium]